MEMKMPSSSPFWTTVNSDSTRPTSMSSTPAASSTSKHPRPPLAHAPHALASPTSTHPQWASSPPSIPLTATPSGKIPTDLSITLTFDSLPTRASRRLMPEQSFDMPLESQSTYRKAVAECFSEPPTTLSWEDEVQIDDVRRTAGQPVLSVDTVVLLDAVRPKLPSRSEATECLGDALRIHAYFHGLLDVECKESQATLLGFPLWPLVAVICALFAMAMLLLLSAAYFFRRRKGRDLVRRIRCSEVHGCSQIETLGTHCMFMEEDARAATKAEKGADLGSPQGTIPAEVHPFGVNHSDDILY
uniref:Uncharacterized protein n=1 Tax=Tetraselmis chuii TaxID=63592 RepID=A0A7S1WZC2_9CHLO